MFGISLILIQEKAYNRMQVDSKDKLEAMGRGSDANDFKAIVDMGRGSDAS